MRSTLVLGLAVGCAAALHAQQPAPRDTARHGMMGRGMMQGQVMQGRQAEGPMMTEMDSMMGPMMQAMAFAPERLLERRDALRLTAEQQRRIAEIRDAARPFHDAAMSSAHQHREEMLRALNAASPEVVRVGAHFQAMHAAMGSAHWEMLEASLLSRAVLTDAQRAQVPGQAGTGVHRH